MRLVTMNCPACDWTENERCTILFYGYVVRTFINTRASHSFISYALACTMRLIHVTLRTSLTVITPMWGNLVLDSIVGLVLW